MTRLPTKLTAALALAGLGLLGACAEMPQPVATPVPASASPRQDNMALPQGGPGAMPSSISGTTGGIPGSASPRQDNTALPAPPSTTSGALPTGIPGSASRRGQGNMP
jgi:hypothetical protein